MRLMRPGLMLGALLGLLPGHALAQAADKAKPAGAPEAAASAAPADASKPAAAAGAAKAEGAPAAAATGEGAEATPAAKAGAAASAEAEGTAPSMPEGDGGKDESFTSTEGDADAIVDSEQTPKLNIYGFADFSYFHVTSSESDILRQYVEPYPTFFVGHLNMYLQSDLGANWRTLAEVRFVYSPTGDDDDPVNGTFPTIDNRVQDYAELQRMFAWGGIEIQRVWIEYQPFEFLTIRGGQWFTPYGYWNEDHGSPVIIGVHKPFPISDYMFPEKQTGLEAYGKYLINSSAVGYALTLSNGRGPMDAIRDLDSNKAIGGRLYFESSALGQFTMGIDAYKGRYTASTKKYTVDQSSGSPIAKIYRQPDSQYDEISYGADVRWLYKGLHIQGEIMANEAVYRDPARPPPAGFAPVPAFAANYRRWGGYFLAGYRFESVRLMPFGMVEHSSYTDTDAQPPSTAWTGGLNFRPTPSVVLKAEYSAAYFHGTGSVGAGAHPLSYFGAQTAWAF